MKILDLNSIKHSDHLSHLKISFFEYSLFSNFLKVLKTNHTNYNAPINEKYTELYIELLTLGFKNIKFQNYDMIFQNHSIKRYNHSANQLRFIYNKYLNISKDNTKNLHITSNLNIYFNLIKFCNNLLYYGYKKPSHIKSKTSEVIETVSYLNSLPLLELSELLNPKKYFEYIIISFPSQYSFVYYRNFSLILFPLFIANITASLQRLLMGGSLNIYLSKAYYQPAVMKIFDLLVVSFEKYQFYDMDTTFLIIFSNFKTIDKTILNKLVTLCYKTKPYYYLYSDYLFYFYHLLKNSTTALGYELDLDEVGILKSYDSPQKNMNVVYDIDPLVKPTKQSQSFQYEMNEQYKKFNEYIKYTILKNIGYRDIHDYQTLYIEKQVFDEIYYKIVISIVKYYEENNIPYNKTYLIYINKYNKNIINKLYTLENNISFTIVKYPEVKRDKLISLKKHVDYRYDEIEKLQDLTFLGYKLKQDLIQNFENNKLPRVIQKVTENFAHGVSQYISATFNSPYRLSNAYINLWEIYQTIYGILPSVKEARIFHIAEAPGQWIYCTRNYIEKKTNIESLDWKAMSLNPKHPNNIKKYGKGIFLDDYGFISNYPKRWLYGSDNTGDFTKSYNILWYRNYIKNWCGQEKLHLITGDAGMRGEGITLRQLQMIDYAQMAMVAACGTVGTNSITKHFLPYIRGIPESYYGTGFFMSYLYMYYLMFKEMRLIKPHTSNPNSGEFYVVCIDKLPIEDIEVTNIVQQLDVFETNMSFFTDEQIPETFIVQIIEFVKRMSNVMTEQYDLQNMLMTCIIDNDPLIDKVTQCKKIMKPEFTKEIQNIRFQEWIKEYRFEI